MQFVYLTGVLLSAAAAVLWGIHNVTVRVGTADGGVADAITVVMATNVVVVAPAAVLFHYPSYGLSPRAVGAFAAAGLCGLLLGRICLFRGIRTIGASRTTPVVSASALVSAVLAIWFLDERLTPAHGIGILLIVSGVAVISWVTATDGDDPPSIGEVGLSLVFPLGAALFIGIEPIFVRVGLDEGTPVSVGLAVMMTTALTGYVVHRRLRGDAIRLPAPGTARRMTLVAGVANTFGLATYFAALAVAPIVVVVPIVQLAPLVVLAISAVFLPRRLERVTWPLAAAAVVVVVGATLVSLSG